ncbi:MAG TPA: hypothetical protein DDZ51_00485 [Planctomycetaceae bacterium]|nr:hypothetical protein [Planctomycetaceae bacterium]
MLQKESLHGVAWHQIAVRPAKVERRAFDWRRFFSGVFTNNELAMMSVGNRRAVLGRDALLLR